jgi:two-component system chemotaxis sensor kinase CheA
MKKIHLNLKSKIFISILFLLTMTVSFNLFYSINLFKNDKKAYIFENSLKRATSTDKQIFNEFQNFKKTSQMLALISESKSADLKNQLSENKSMELSFELLPVGEHYEYLKFNLYNDKTIFLKKRTPLELKDFLQELIKKEIIKINAFSLLDFNGKYFFSYAIKNEFNNNLFVTLIDGKNILSILGSDQAFNNILFWKTDKGLKAIPPHPHSQDLIKMLNKNETTRGAKENQINNEKYILGFSKNKDLEFATTATIAYDSAFKITNSLILKTVNWAAVLLGFVIIFGVLFAASIVKPIKVLTEAANKIAEGELDVVIKLNSNDEFKTLANTFEYMISTVKSLLQAKQGMIEDLKISSAKLADLNKNLELIVKERTKELNTSNIFMKAMVNSLNQGLVVFNRELVCNKIHTEATRNILGKEPSGLFFYNLLDLNEDDQSTMIDWAMVTFEELLPFESAATLAPPSRTWGKNVNDPDYKFVSLEYFPMRDGEGKISNIVAVSTDQTKEYQATEKAKESKAEVAMLVKILSNKKQFSSFIQEIDSIIQAIKESFNDQSEKSCKTLMMLFHTLNGGFGLYKLLELQKMARGCEVEVDLIVKAEQFSKDAFEATLIPPYNKLVATFREKIQEIESTLGFKFSGNIVILEMDSSDLQKMKDKISKVANPELSELYDDLFMKELIYDYLKGYDSFIAQEALKIDKKIDPLEINHHDIKLNMNHYREVLNNLIHLFRNSLDHGIEKSDVRLSLGKSPKGKIVIDVELKQNFVYLTISDNGGGISIERIKNKMRSLNLETENKSDLELLNIIFEPFFSTKDEVSALSGRGVGMSSVKEAIDNIGGTIEIVTKLNVGTSFIFKLPLINS